MLSVIILDLYFLVLRFVFIQLLLTYLSRVGNHGSHDQREIFWLLNGKFLKDEIFCSQFLQKCGKNPDKFLSGMVFLWTEGLQTGKKLSGRKRVCWCERSFPEELEGSFLVERELPDGRKRLFLLGGRFSDRTEAFKYKWEASLLAVYPSNKFSWTTHERSIG